MTELCREKFDHICRLCSSPLTTVKHEICGKLGLSNIIEECLQIKVSKILFFFCTIFYYNRFFQSICLEMHSF